MPFLVCSFIVMLLFFACGSALIQDIQSRADEEERKDGEPKSKRCPLCYEQVDEEKKFAHRWVGRDRGKMGKPGLWFVTYDYAVALDTVVIAEQCLEKSLF